MRLINISSMPSVILFLLILIGSVYLYKNETPLQNRAPTQGKSFPVKSYLYNFKSYRYDEYGQLKEVINSEIALDFPKVNEIQLTKPSIETHGLNKTIWMASANIGVMKNNNTLVTLKDNVSISSGEMDSKIKTSEIQIDLLKRTAQTEKEIILSHNDGETLAIGMSVNLEKAKLKLISEVHTTLLGNNE